MNKETLEDPREIIEFTIPPPIGDERIHPAYLAFDFAIAAVNLIFMFLWMLVCLFIWLAIGTPLFIILWLIANIFDFLSRPFRKS